mmetsp:Transcript_35609/g.63321  ORF Transcript_35609/g.63321 Transcript_35609/m.63321 type:complete len:467 (+) Transcript_35609:39-1439(+)
MAAVGPSPCTMCSFLTLLLTAVVNMCSGSDVLQALPKPTAAQLRWADLEIGALIHFNMMTFGSCNADPSGFQPAKLDTDQWAQSFADLGVREAVLVAKHGCGYTLWPSNATEPDGKRYNYSVAFSSWRSGRGDVLADFIASCSKRGIGVGYYYSLGSNKYADRMNWTKDELMAIEKQQVVELWDTYGHKGNLTEIWFDGGFEGAMKPFVQQKLAELQPEAVAFNGCIQQGGHPNKSSCITPNSVRWVGNEGGNAPIPDWSTGYANGGDPNADIFQPTEADTTLQNGDQWFYNPSVGLRSMKELVDVYHQTVGRNAFLMMDFAPNKDGLIAPDQVARYKELGDWIRACYTTPIAAAGPTAVSNDSPMMIKLASPASIDRVVLMEDQTKGQAARAYVVEVQTESAATWTHVSNGTSIGHKKIDRLAQAVTVHAVRVRITASAGAVTLRSAAVYKCTDPAPPEPLEVIV